MKFANLPIIKSENSTSIGETGLTPQSYAEPVIAVSDRADITADEQLFGRAPSIATTRADADRRARWSAARFGFFVHWGLPAIPAGRWNGKPVDGLAEWIQFKARIPLAEYRQLAGRFHPRGFDARQWVGLAAAAGCKYFVYTAKHHDGFAMYGSKVSAYNVVTATPFGRDPLTEIAEACREHGLMLGLYYSQTIDWEDPDAVGPQCNDWDFDPARGNFTKYWRRKALPQLTELLTDYGDIGLLWFDMPKGIPPACASEASDLVRKLAPVAVINSRLGDGGEADYQSMDDNYVNNNLPDRDWETAATTNDTWAYAENAGGWKPAAALCEALAYNVSRGGNYLLNAGPDADGQIPRQAIDQFEAISRWMHRAGAGIHGGDASPFPATLESAVFTRHGASLFAHVTNPSLDVLELSGLSTPPSLVIDRATGAELAVIPADALSPMSVALAKPTDELPRTVELRFALQPMISNQPVQSPGRPLRLDIWGATRPAGGRLRWEFQTTQAGHFKVVLLSKQTFRHTEPRWHSGGLTGRLITVDGEQPFVLCDHGHEPYPILHYWELVHSDLGTLHICEPGLAWIEIRDLAVCDSKWEKDAVNVVGIRLIPATQ